MKHPARKLLFWASRIGANPTDDRDLRLQKSLLVLCAMPFALAGFLWGALYFYFDEHLAGYIPLAYGVFSLISILYFSYSRRYGIFRFSQLIMILLLPTFLMLSLGGFILGSAVIVWAFICPIGALLFDKPQNAPRWFLAFVILVAFCGLIQSRLDPTTNLPPEVITVLFVLNVTAVSSLIFLMVFSFVAQKNVFQEQSETLLLNILPKEIVAILEEGPTTIAEHYDGASILFADIAEFTPMSANMTPDELVMLLNEIFSYFDRLVEKYDLEKIKTIGDCYMVAAGVPRTREDHAQALTMLAIEMRDYVEQHEILGHRLSFRIGINSGPVVAGVIGRKKFIYDLWGEAVNTASRMESQGREGFIQITRATHELIKDQFVCEQRGWIEVKGLGQTETWFVIQAKD